MTMPSPLEWKMFEFVINGGKIIDKTIEGKKYRYLVNRNGEEKFAGKIIEEEE